MRKVVKVTPAQVNAARLAIKRSAVSGRSLPSSITRIANATKAPATSSPSGGRGTK